MQYKIISGAERNILGTTVKLLLTTLARFFFVFASSVYLKMRSACNLVFHPKKRNDRGIFLCNIQRKLPFLDNEKLLIEYDAGRNRSFTGFLNKPFISVVSSQR